MFQQSRIVDSKGNRFFQELCETDSFSIVVPIENDLKNGDNIGSFFFIFQTITFNTIRRAQNR
jgi:hypothetical protein